jgi:hypothetical protein
MSNMTIEEAYVDAHVQLFLAQPSQTGGGGLGSHPPQSGLRRFLWQTLFQRAERQGGKKTATAIDNWSL